MIEAEQVNHLSISMRSDNRLFFLYLTIQQLATMRFQIGFASDPQPLTRKSLELVKIYRQQNCKSMHASHDLTTSEV
jgi:hypothetical protein